MTQPQNDAPTAADVRAWAYDHSEYEVGTRGRLAREVVEEYNAAHPNAPYTPKQ